MGMGQSNYLMNSPGAYKEIYDQGFRPSKQIVNLSGAGKEQLQETYSSFGYWSDGRKGGGDGKYREWVNVDKKSWNAFLKSLETPAPEKAADPEPVKPGPTQSQPPAKGQPDPVDRAKPLPPVPNVPGGISGSPNPPKISATPTPEEAQARQDALAPRWRNKKAQPSLIEQFEEDETLLAGARPTQALLSRSMISGRVYAPGGRIYR